MKKLKIFIGILFLLTGLLVACDDFFSPTIEIFNETTTPTNVEQQQNKKKKEQNINTELAF